MMSRWFNLWRTRPASGGIGAGGPAPGPAQHPQALRTIRRVLVLAPDDAGLLLLTTPALRHLRRSLPQARIDLIGAAGLELLTGTGLVDRIADAPSVDRGGIAWPWHRRPDLLLDYRGLDRPDRRRARWHFRHEPAPTIADPHEIRRRVALLDTLLPMPATPPDVEMGFSAADESWAVQRLQRRWEDEASLSLLLNVTPDWPAERWEALARAVLDVPHTRLFVSGSPIRLPRSPRCEPLGAVPNGLALAAFVGRLDLLISGAALPMHMVGATETPAVLLLSADDAARLVPLAGDPVLAVARAGAALATLPVGRVMEAVHGALIRALDRQQHRLVSQRRTQPPTPRPLMPRPGDAPKR